MVDDDEDDFEDDVDHIVDYRNSDLHYWKNLYKNTKNELSKERTIVYRYEELMQYKEDVILDLEEDISLSELQLAEANEELEKHKVRTGHIKNFLEKNGLSIEDLDEFITESFYRSSTIRIIPDSDIKSDCECISRNLDSLHGDGKRLFGQLEIQDDEYNHYVCYNCQREMKIKKENT